MNADDTGLAEFRSLLRSCLGLDPIHEDVTPAEPSHVRYYEQLGLDFVSNIERHQHTRSRS